MLAEQAFREYPRRVRRIERLINLIAALLETPRPMTAEQIKTGIAGYEQTNHEAFRRSFERDKKDLRDMGIPIETRPVSQDPFQEHLEGYIIPKDRYYLPELDLEPDELAALRLASDAILGGGEEAAAGLMKLSVDAPDSVGGPRITWSADIAAESPSLAPLYAALLERKPVAFEYEPASGPSARRKLEPYSLVHRRGNWYVVGKDQERGEPRAFRLSRITSDIDELDGTYEIPKGFDADAHIGGAAFEVGAEVETGTIRFSPDLRWWAEQNLGEAPSTERPDGSLEVALPVGNPSALVSWVIGFGGGVEIVSPAVARQALLDHLEPFVRSEAP